MTLRTLLHYLQQLTPEQLESEAAVYNPLTKRINPIDYLETGENIPDKVKEKSIGSVIMITRPQV